MKFHTLFRWFYVGFYAFLHIILAILLIITPADAIRQALSNKQLYQIFVIAGSYCLTLVLAIILYSTRLYTDNAILKAIPKTWIPIEKGDVSKKVRRMIVASLDRSATLAWDARPHISDEPVSDPEARISNPITQESNEGHRIMIPPPLPVWGDIAHGGWSSPMSPDMPNLQYITVILELPHLIEAKAVSLAPADANSASNPPMPDIRAVDILQRPASMGLRDYIGHLSNVGIITSFATATEFLSLYEHARFSGKPINGAEFRDLMKHFAEVLRNMKTLNSAMLDSLDLEPPDSDTDDNNLASKIETPRSRSQASSDSASSRNRSAGTIRTTRSRNFDTNITPPKKRHDIGTAPATPRTKKRINSLSPSIGSFSQRRRFYNNDNGSSSTSFRLSSQQSVIKLSRTPNEEELPYTLHIPRAEWP